MVAKFNPFPDPQKGKGRTLLKRPAMKKNKTWDAVKYTRTTSLAAGPGGQRMDRFKWKRSLTQLLTATPLNVVKMLRADRILPKWEGKVCPRCEKGTLSGLKLEAGTGMPRHRCSHWKCRVYINPQHLHPLFVDGRGAAAQPLQTQAALLMLKLNNISNPAVHRLLHVNHKMIEDLDKRLRHARKTWVEAKEKDIVFGKDQKWADVEADETTLDRMDLGNTAPDPKNPVVWEQWCGIVQRGHPETLVLSRLSPRESAKRAPGPGAIRKTRVPGVLHDKVVHGKKRVKVKGQWK
ncbi:unnamed protein product [Effrenium voratum]|nr:unnamed protein product [Effrenium voratum]